MCCTISLGLFFPVYLGIQSQSSGSVSCMFWFSAPESNGGSLAEPLQKLDSLVGPVSISCWSRDPSRSGSAHPEKIWIVLSSCFQTELKSEPRYELYDLLSAIVLLVFGCFNHTCFNMAMFTIKLLYSVYFLYCCKKMKWSEIQIKKHIFKLWYSRLDAYWGKIWSSSQTSLYYSSLPIMRKNWFKTLSY